MRDRVRPLRQCHGGHTTATTTTTTSCHGGVKFGGALVAVQGAKMAAVAVEEKGGGKSNNWRIFVKYPCTSTKWKKLITDVSQIVIHSQQESSPNVILKLRLVISSFFLFPYIFIFKSPASVVSGCLSFKKKNQYTFGMDIYWLGVTKFRRGISSGTTLQTTTSTARWTSIMSRSSSSSLLRSRRNTRAKPWAVASI